MKISQIFKFGVREVGGPAVAVRKFFWFFFWGSLVPIVAISAIVYFSGQTILQKQAIESLLALNNAKSEQLNLFIERLKVRTADWSSDYRIRGDAERISQGEPLSKELSLYLRDKKLPIDPLVVLADVLDTKGIVIASSDQSRFGKDESGERISFSKALTASFGEAIFTPELVVETDELAGTPMLHLAAPLVSAETGKIVGVLLLHIKNDELNKVLIIKEKKTLETYLVNREKLMITSSRFISDAVLKQSVDTPPVRACLDRGKDYSGPHLNYRGEPVFGVSKCLPVRSQAEAGLPEGLGVIITEIDVSEAFISINIFRNVAASAIAIILALTLIYVLWSGKKLLPTTTTTTTTTIIIIIIIINIMGFAFSLFFSNAIGTFAEHTKTEPVFDLVQGQAGRHIGDAKYFADWQSAESQQKFKEFVSELKASLPPLAAVKIYNKEAILIWSDLAVYKEVIGKKHEEGDVRETLEKGQLTKSVGTEIQRQIGSSNLLEIYIPVYFADKSAAAGVAGVYFDTSDLADFVRRLQIFIWGIIGISLAIIYSLLYFVFKRQNDQINRQAKELSSIIDKSPIGIFTINRDGIVDSFNPKMVELAGAKNAKQAIGLNALELPTSKKAGLDEFYRDGLAGKPFEVEAEYTSYTGGKTIYGRFFGIPLFELGGETVERLLLMVDDITDRKELERKLAKYTEDVEQLVLQRTVQLEEKVAELEKINDLMIGRELKMIELKNKIEELNKGNV